jgi:hypothetical protein
MSDTYEINDDNEVIPYTSGRKCNDTRAWRDATNLELQQREDIVRLERELVEAKEQRQLSNVCRRLECERDAYENALRRIYDLSIDGDEIWSDIEQISAIAHNALNHHE